MTAREQTVLLISDDPSFCAAARKELQSDEGSLRVASVNNVEAAREIVEDASPAVIVLEQSVVEEVIESVRARQPKLDSVVSSLAAYAPVVVMGTGENGAALTALVAAGAADYVGRSEGSLQTAAELVRRRLQHAKRVVVGTTALEECEQGDADEARRNLEEFGEVLRHELNNPLTGILGNAELVLVELKRKTDGRIPTGFTQRLETIAALAVRMRETIRRLSQEWEARRDTLRTR